MKYIFFTDPSLSEFLNVTKNSTKLQKIQDLTVTDKTVIIVPNEILNLVEIDSNTKMVNKDNIEAMILNQIASNSITNASNLKVLSTTKKNQYYVISLDNLKKLKSVFSQTERSLNIASDLTYFSAFKSNIFFNDLCYLYENKKSVKLKYSSYKLLENQSKLKEIDENELYLNDNDVSMTTLNSLNLIESISSKKFYKYLYVLLGVFVLVNLVGLLNIYHNQNQIESMDQTIKEIYEDIYPGENSPDISLDIKQKYNNINYEKNTILLQIQRLISLTPTTVNITNVEVKLNDSNTVKIIYLFQNEVDESLFINNMQQAGYKTAISNREIISGYIQTEINYEF